MHEIRTQAPDPEFVSCWQAAGGHLQKQAEGMQLNWLKSDLEPPFLEHLSFMLVNQLFFVRIEGDGDQLEVPGSRAGVLKIAKECNGHACLLRMKRGPSGWVPVGNGWGLREINNAVPVVPPELVNEDLVEMTDWELHDFAVQVVRNGLEKDGRKIMSAQGNPSVAPSLWFVGEDGPEWVVVRAARFPARTAQPPSDWAMIEESTSALSKKGHFASVTVASSEGSLESDSPPIPLWRGCGVRVSYTGLEPGPAAK